MTMMMDGFVDSIRRTFGIAEPEKLELDLDDEFDSDSTMPMYQPDMVALANEIDRRLVAMDTMEIDCQVCGYDDEPTKRYTRAELGLVEAELDIANGNNGQVR